MKKSSAEMNGRRGARGLSRCSVVAKCGRRLSALESGKVTRVSELCEMRALWLAAVVAVVACDPCYDEGRSRRCIPDFVNAAFGAEVVASSTCGQREPERLCDPPKGSDTEANEDVCTVCDSKRPDRRQPASHLTDLNNPRAVTCWRSSAVPPASPAAPADNVSLTLSLAKRYELTYVSLQFCPGAARPDSVAIYKSADEGATWQPFQFYSSQCKKVYGRPSRAALTAANEQEARCSDASVTGASANRLAFSTLEGRPGAAYFDASPVLQDWVTATDIRVVFNRLHAAKEDNSGRAPVGTQHYALADFAVGGRCKCNGHAAKCSPGSDGKLSCECKHNTAGRDCERCKPFHFDRPWGRATAKEANECKGKRLLLLFYVRKLKNINYRRSFRTTGFVIYKYKTDFFSNTVHSHLKGKQCVPYKQIYLVVEYCKNQVIVT